MTVAFVGADIFDGQTRHVGAALVVAGDKVSTICDPADVPPTAQVKIVDGLIAPGLIDLQVNGGGGLMFNNAPNPDTLRTIAAAHVRRGTTALLPTLITDTPEVTGRAIAAARQAMADAVPGIVGLHLEGPHLSVARKGAHDPARIRTMTAEDCADLCVLAGELPSLMLTVAPESTSNAQISQLSGAGAVVSLGHSDGDFQTAMSAAAAGATCVTHLFNAMSPLASREPGVVGAALQSGALHAGLIADGIHVDAATIAVALRAKTGPGRIFLVSDAMALAGSDAQEFSLNDRLIYRKDGALRLADGTLAGADLDMLAAVRFMVSRVGLSVEDALRMATAYPAAVLGRDEELGSLRPGARADLILLDGALELAHVWQHGIPVA